MNLKEKIHKIAKFLENNIPVILPYQKIKIIWDIFILLSIIWFFFVLPLEISFHLDWEDDLTHYLERKGFSYKIAHFLVIIPEIMIIIDTFLKLITGYYENGVVIKDKIKIIHHYFHKTFLFDLIAYLPLILHSLLKNQDSNSEISFLKILQLLLFFKIPRVQTVLKNFQEMISLKGQNDHILSIFILGFKLIFFTHIIACIWHAFSYYSDPTMSITWLDISSLRGSSWIERYSHSMYWSAGCVFAIGGSERNGPNNNSEFIFAVFVYLTSGFFYAFSINMIREIFIDFNKKNRVYK